MDRDGTAPLPLEIPKTPRRKVPITVLLDVATHRQLKAVARQHKATLSTTVYHIVQAAVSPPVAPETEAEAEDRRTGQDRRTGAA